jgi:ubiquinone/menaquinone biosynthesis C-methylase UbiE
MDRAGLAAPGDPSHLLKGRTSLRIHAKIVDMDTSNHAARSARVAALFDKVADTYEGVGVPWFVPIAEGLVRAVSPQSGERAVDIGCGRGAALLPLAEAVGVSGHVTGIDLAPKMVEAARAAAQGRGLTNVDVQVMDAGSPELSSSSFDLVASSLVVFFLPDPAAALSAWRELLVPGGRLGITTFAQRDPQWEVVDAVFRPYLPQDMLDARTSGETGPFSSDAGVDALVAAAGFTEVHSSGFDVEVTFSDAEQWRAWTFSHGQRAMWECVPQAKRGEVLAQAAELLEERRGGDGLIRLTQRVRLTMGLRRF